MDIKIRAFGAAIIGGIPHRPENSFFHLATERLRQETGHHIVSSIHMLGALPVPRALTQVSSRCLVGEPNIVVLQFGSSDLTVPLRNKRQQWSEAALSSLAARTRLAHPANLMHTLRWRVRGLIGDALKLKPVTAPEVYLGAMDYLIRAVAARGAIPIVLSPFVLGSQRSNRIARHCVPALGKLVAAVPNAYYVEVFSTLEQFPRREILLRDGRFLTIPGQVVVAECLFTVLGRVLEEQKEALGVGCT